MRRVSFGVVAALLLTGIVLGSWADRATINVTDRPPLESISIGDLVDVKGKGKSFTGPGTITLTDQRVVAVTVTLKYNAKKGASSFKIATAKGTFPKIKVKIKTLGDPAAIVQLSFSMKDADKTKAKIKESGNVTVAEIVEHVDPVLSDNLTMQAVKALVSGDEDFAAMITKLDDAASADGSNVNPGVFRPLCVFLDYLNTALVKPGGSMLELYADAGLERVAGTGFWDIAVDNEIHAEGDIKDSVAHTDDWRDVLRNETLPKVQELIDALAASSAAFEYRMDFVDAGGEFFDGSLLDDTEVVWFDAGDVHLLRAALLVSLALADLLDAYDFDDTDPNAFDAIDFPDLDPLSVFENTYTKAGKLVRPERFTTARNHLEAAYAAYQAGAAYILAETTTQSDNGLVTPYRTMLRGVPWFDDTVERDQFVSEEASFRTWAGEIIAAFDGPGNYTFARRVDGTALPADQQFTVDFVEFWAGIDLRGTWFSTVEDPFTGETISGVSSLGDLTQDMFTAEGALVELHGEAPVAGDLRALGALRLASVPTSAKTIDGNLSDWSPPGNSTVIMTSTVATQRAPLVDFGQGYLSRDSGNLYLAFTVDLADLDDLIVTVEGPSGLAESYGDGFPWGNNENPVEASTAAGLELKVPLSNFGTDEWVEISILMEKDGVNDFRGGRIFVPIN